MNNNLLENIINYYISEIVESHDINEVEARNLLNEALQNDEVEEVLMNIVHEIKEN